MRRAVAKVRVYELAKELGIESKVVMTKLTEMGEFVRSASSTVEPPVVRKLREIFPAPAAGAAISGADGAAAFFAGFGAGAASAAGAGKISRSLRTTGGSTVDDADRTNSPISVSLVMTTLLSMPSSFASS